MQFNSNGSFPMGTMSSQRKLLLFYLITSLGYSVTGLTTFLNIENVFHSMGYLGLALSLRTLSSCILGYKANHLIQKINIQNSFLLTFIFGALSIVCIFCGFHTQNIAIVLLGVVLIGIPATLTTILLTITLRISSKDSDEFRRFSGTRELIFGIARLVACLLAPIILLFFGMNIVILLNIITFIFGLLIINVIDLTHLTYNNTPDAHIKINSLILQSKFTWEFILQACSSLFLIALIPLLASSDKIEFTKHLPTLLRQSLWSVEAFTMICGSGIYLIAKKIRGNEFVKTALMMNGIFLYFLVFIKQPYAIVLVVMFISMMIMISFYIFRDDYILNANNDTRLIEAHAAFSSVMKDLICSISPGLLTLILMSFTLNIAVFVIVVTQGILYMMYKILNNQFMHQRQFQV